MRILKNGDEITLVGNGFNPSVKYIIENSEIREAVIKIDPEDKILSISKGFSGIKTNLEIKKVLKEDRPFIQILGKDNQVVSEIDAYEFVADSFLKDVEIDNGMIHFKFTIRNEAGLIEEKNVFISFNDIVKDSQEKLNKKIDSLEKKVEELEKALNSRISEISALLRCLDKDAIRKIIPADNQLKVSEKFIAESDNSEKKIKAIEIGFAEDTYFIAGE